jgi:hypothetical protein
VVVKTDVELSCYLEEGGGGEREDSNVIEVDLSGNVVRRRRRVENICVEVIRLGAGWTISVREKITV